MPGACHEATGLACDFYNQGLAQVTIHLAQILMSTAIIGLAQAGKTTVFNALTRAQADKGQYGAGKSVNIGLGVKPDTRLDFIDAAFSARRKVRAEMTYWDIPVDYATGAVLSRETVNSLQKTKALVTVVRKFDDASIPHPDGSIDWLRDLEKLAFEILFADIELLDRRVERITTGMKSLKSSERTQAAANVEALKRLQSSLEDGKPLRSLQLDENESRALSGSFTLSSLPYVVAVNVGEDEIEIDADELRLEAQARIGINTIDEETRVLPICGSIEEELRNLEDDDEAAELRSDLGIARDDSEALMDASLKCLSTQTFYTASEREARAWHFRQGALAPEAAGIIHSDLERGFIRAEVIAYDDFLCFPSMAQARKNGVLRQEGRDYTVQDGDLVHFLFSV